MFATALCAAAFADLCNRRYRGGYRALSHGSHDNCTVCGLRCQPYLQKIKREMCFMKIVVVKVPKFLSGVLRRIFKIDKDE